MRTTALTHLLLCLAFSIPPAAFAQQAATVSVTGAVKQPLTLTAADLASMPRATVTTNNNGTQITYEGVWLSDVLKRAGVPLGAGLNGPALATYVLATASDGYQVLFSLGELDPEMTDGQFLLADKGNGRSLVVENSGFRIVAPKDKRAARSVRLVTSLEVVQVKK